MNKLQKRGKRILVMVLVFAILCTSLPSTFTFGLFTQIQPIHAAAEEQQVTWYEITTKINSSWGGHISGEITITNNSSQPRQDWQIALFWQAQITSMWNGKFQQNGQSYLITPMEYNATLQPNDSVSIGFTAEGDDTILDSFVSENFLTESGAEITDAEQRASQPDQPQTMPTPGAMAVPTAESTQTPSAITETPVPTHPFTTASPIETPIVATEEPTTTAIPTVGTPEPTVTVTPAVTPTITPVQTPSPEPTVTVTPTVTPTIIPVQTPSPEPTVSLEPVYPDRYLTSGITLQEDTTFGSLYILSGGYVDLNGYTLTIQKDIRIHTDRNAFLSNGTICLGGDLIQSPAAATGSLQLNDSVAFILCGSQSQKMELAHPQTSRLGQLDLGDSQEVYLPEEIHSYSLAGLAKASLPETFCLEVSRFNLDSDIHIPGSLIFLDGFYHTDGYQIEIEGNLEIQGESSDQVFMGGGKMIVHGETYISRGMLGLYSGAEIKSDGDIHVTNGSLELISGTVEAGGNLFAETGGRICLSNGLLKIRGNWEISGTSHGSNYIMGEIQLYGDLIQQEEAGLDSFNLGDEVRFRLKGSKAQNIYLNNPENTRLGQLDLSSCQEAHLPEEIHCYSLSGIRNLYAGDVLRLGVSRFNLDSDVQIPGSLIFLDGFYHTDGYQIEIEENLEIQGKSSDQVFMGGGKMTIHGETYISGGMLGSYSGAEIKSDGDIHVANGSLEIISGTVEAGGNLFAKTGGGICLSDGLLKIRGNWEISGTSHGSNYIMGEIQLYGDLIQQEEADLNSFRLENNVIFMLKGSKPQTITLSYLNEARLGQLNLSDSAGVTFEGNASYSEDTLYLTGASLKNLEKIKNKGSLCLEFDNIYLEDDLDYPGDLECQGNLVFNSHDMTIRGDLEMDGNLNTPGTLDIHGNYTAVSGITDCGTGTIRVRKNFRLKEMASLSMGDAAARLLVEGNFMTSATGTSYLSAGTIELKGDLIQTIDSSDRSLEQTGTHFLFSGAEKQMVILGRREENTHFQYLDLRESAGVTFTSGCLYANNITGWDRIDNSCLVVCNARLIQQQSEVFHGSLTLINSTLDCNGQVFWVEDGVELSDTDLVLNQGTFISGGDFTITGAGFLMMRQEKDQLVVQGDFQTSSTFSHSGALIDGRLELHGDFNQAGHGASFAATDNHLTVFAGEEPQAVHFEDKENSHFAKVIVSGAGYYTDDETETKVLGVSKNILLGMEDGLEEFIEASVVGLPLAIAIATVGEVTGTGHIIIVGAAAYFVGMLAADAIITADGDGDMYQKARQFGRDLILFLPTLLSVKEIPNAAGEVEELANKSENVKAALQKLCNPKTYRQLLDHMKEALRNESGSIDLSGSFRNLGKLRSALAKAETADDAIRCCQEIFEEEAFQSLLKDHGDKDVAVVINYMKNLISAAEKAERKLTGKEADYITWSCDHGIASETFLADVFLDRSTKPSGKPGGKPRGVRADETKPGYKGQNHAADVLADEGYDVVMLKEEQIEVDGVTLGNGYGFDPGSNPDYLVENRVFEAYTPTKAKTLKTIKREIQGKTKEQTDNIIIVTEFYEGDVGELKSFLLSQTKNDLKHLRELKAIVNGKVEAWFVR